MFAHDPPIEAFLELFPVAQTGVRGDRGLGVSAGHSDGLVVFGHDEEEGLEAVEDGFDACGYGCIHFFMFFGGVGRGRNLL